MNKEKIGFGSVTFILLILVLLLGTFLIGTKINNSKISSLRTSTINPSTAPAPSSSPEIIYKGDTSDISFKNITFKGCGTNLPNYEYSLQLPSNWTITKRKLGGLFDTFSVYFDAQGNGEQFTISCTTQGVGGDICDNRGIWTKFTVGADTEEACWGQIDGKWTMGVLNLKRDPSSQAAIAFWAEGIERLKLNQIFSTFRYLK